MKDSGQTSRIVTLEWYKDLIRFWWPWLNFQGHHTIKTVKFSNFDQKSLSAPYLLNQMTDSGQTSYIVTLGWLKDLVGFWWSWPNFQGHHTIKTVKMSLVCTLPPERISGFWPNLHRNTIETWGRNDKILVTLTSCQILPKKKACLHPTSWTKWWILYCIVWIIKRID